MIRNLRRWWRLRLAAFAGWRAAVAWERFEIWGARGRRWRQ